MRIIAPDLPGYGWSGPPAHRWAKEDVATDVLALLDALGLDHVLLVAHDWGAYVGYRMILRAPERFDGYLAMNMAHPWQKPARSAAAFVEAVLPGAAGDIRSHVDEQRTKFVEKLIFGIGSDMAPEDATSVRRAVPQPGVCPRGQRHLSYVPDTRITLRRKESRDPTGDGADPRAVRNGRRAVSPSMVSPETANADDYTLETVDATHFVVDERPDLVRKKLIALAEETSGV